MPKKLFVGGLPFVYTDEELRALFTGAGKVVSAEMVFDPDRNRSRGFGFVEMGSPEEGVTAISQVNGKQIGEKKVFVTEAREKKPTPTNPNASSTPCKKKIYRKVGRNPLGKASTAPAPNPYATPGKWAPREDRKRSFSSPRNPKGDFGSRDSGKPPKKGFWSKFEKKKK